MAIVSVVLSPFAGAFERVSASFAGAASGMSSLRRRRDGSTRRRVAR
jgi:hypothetical protein